MTNEEKKSINISELDRAVEVLARRVFPVVTIGCNYDQEKNIRVELVISPANRSTTHNDIKNKIIVTTSHLSDNLYIETMVPWERLAYLTNSRKVVESLAVLIMHQLFKHMVED